MAKTSWKPGNMIYPLPAVMVTCRDKGQDNIITIAWTGTICTNPPMTYISVRPERHSYEMIKNSGEFVINLTTKQLTRATDFCGVRSGRDVDKFKEVNDHYGHAVGDIVLSTLGQTLRNYFRENDIIGRIGGDEFVIYMCKTESKERAVTRILALADTVKNLSFAEMNGHHITISIGISFAPEHGTCYMDLYKNADTALYETKQNGRNGYFLFQKQDSII